MKNKTGTILSVAELIEVLQQFPPDAIPFVLHYGKDHAHGIVKEDIVLGTDVPYCPNRSFDPIFDLGVKDDDDNTVFDKPFLMLCGI